MALFVKVEVTVMKSIHKMSLVGYLIYSIDQRGVYYVFTVFEEVFVGIVHLIHPIIHYPLFPSLLTSRKIGLPTLKA